MSTIHSSDRRQNNVKLVVREVLLHVPLGIHSMSPKRSRVISRERACPCRVCLQDTEHAWICRTLQVSVFAKYPEPSVCATFGICSSNTSANFQRFQSFAILLRACFGHVMWVEKKDGLSDTGCKKNCDVGPIYALGQDVAS